MVKTAIFFYIHLQNLTIFLWINVISILFFKVILLVPAELKLTDIWQAFFLSHTGTLPEPNSVYQAPRLMWGEWCKVRWGGVRPEAEHRSTGQCLDQYWLSYRQTRSECYGGGGRRDRHEPVIQAHTHFSAVMMTVIVDFHLNLHFVFSCPTTKGVGVESFCIGLMSGVPV